MTIAPAPSTAIPPAGPAPTSSHIGFGQATAGSIKDVGVLDLTHVTSAVQLDLPTDISDVGVVLVRDSVAGRLGAVPMRGVGAVVAVPDTAEVVRQAGAIRLAGEALGAPGHEDEVLVLAGVLVITTPVERVAYRSVIVVGVLVAPEGSEPALSTISVTGAVSYYRAGAVLRVVLGQETYGREFFGYLEEPVSLVVVGDLTIEPDVPIDLLREKVRGITLIGTIIAPTRLVPLVQVLTVDKLGDIKVLAETEPALAPGE